MSLNNCWLNLLSSAVGLCLFIQIGEAILEGCHSSLDVSSIMISPYCLYSWFLHVIWVSAQRSLAQRGLPQQPNLKQASVTCQHIHYLEFSQQYASLSSSWSVCCYIYYVLIVYLFTLKANGSSLDYVVHCYILHDQNISSQLIGAQ